MTRDQERRIAAATPIGLNAVRPILQFQVSLLRFWADNIEKFAQKGPSGEIEQKEKQQRPSVLRPKTRPKSGAAHETELNTGRTNVEQIER